MTAPDYTALCAQAEAAMEGTTEGPWEPCHNEEYSEVVRYEVPFTSIADVLAVPDATFIAWARNNVPALIAAIRELEARVGNVAFERECEAEDKRKAERDAAEWQRRAEAAEVERDAWAQKYATASDTYNVMHFKLEAAEAQIAALTARVERLTGALRGARWLMKQYDYQAMQPQLAEIDAALSATEASHE